jgi:hypothetical protein
MTAARGCKSRPAQAQIGCLTFASLPYNHSKLMVWSKGLKAVR